MTVIVPNVFKVRKIYPLVLEKWPSLEWTKQNPVSVAGVRVREMWGTCLGGAELSMRVNSLTQQ